MLRRTAKGERPLRANARMPQHAQSACTRIREMILCRKLCARLSAACLGALTEDRTKIETLGRQHTRTFFMLAPAAGTVLSASDWFDGERGEQRERVEVLSGA